MAKVLLVDTNFSSEPIYSELMAMGHEVHVVGNNPEDCLAKISPHYWNLDYSNVGALSDLVERNKYGYLVPGCTDRSYASCVAVSRGRFPGFDSEHAWEVVNNKSMFRVAAERLALPAPRSLKEHAGFIDGLVIVKPVDAFSGKGMTIVDPCDDFALQSAIAIARQASPSGGCLVEEFVEGQLYSHSAFISKGKILQEFVVREDGTTNPFVVDTSHVLENADPRWLASLERAVESLARDLCLVDGLLHTQFIGRGNDIWLIEMTRRCPGDLYSQLIGLSTGYPYVRSYILPFMGEQLPQPSEGLFHLAVMRHTITLSTSKHLAYIHFKRPLQIERFVPLALVGDLIKPSPLSRIGILFCSAADEEELASIYRQTLARELYAIRH